MVVETLVYSPSIHLTLLLARQRFIEFSRREHFILHKPEYDLQILKHVVILYIFISVGSFRNYLSHNKHFCTKRKKLITFQRMFLRLTAVFGP
jgi:hypothetical protein